MIINIAIGILLFSVILISYFILKKVFESGIVQKKLLSSVSEIEQKNYLAIPVEKIVMVSVILSALLFISGIFLAKENLIAGIMLGFVIAIFAFFFPHFIVTRIIEKRLQKLNEELPPTLELLSNSLRAGLTLIQAIERNIDRMPKTTADEFRIVLYECKIGKSLTEALNNFADRTSLMDVRLTAIAAELSLRYGGNLSTSFYNLAKLIRERYLFQKEVSALTAEGKMQAIVMTALPFVIIIVMTLIRRDEMLVFLSSKTGVISVVTVFIMQLLAYIWINKIVSIKV